MNFCHRLSAMVGTDGPQKPLEGAEIQLECDYVTSPFSG